MMSALPKHDDAPRSCLYGDQEEGYVRMLLRELLGRGDTKPFAAAAGMNPTTVCQQLNGIRSVSLRLAHLAQAFAGRWPVSEYLDSRLGLATVRIPEPRSTGQAPFEALAEAGAALGQLSKDLLAHAHLAGRGSRVNEIDLRRIERDAWAAIARVREVAMTVEAKAAGKLASD